MHYVCSCKQTTKRDLLMMNKSDKRALGYITLVTFFLFAYFTLYINATDQSIQEVENYRIITLNEN